MNFRDDERPSLSNAEPCAPSFDDGPRSNVGYAPGQASPLEIFDRYARQAKLTPATIGRLRPVMAKIEDEHPRMADITHEWCVGWVDRLTASGLSWKTVRNVYLASLRAVCRWAVANGELAADPMDGVTIKIPMPMPARSKGFSDRGAKAILSATLRPFPESLAPHDAAARRWIPWLCAYLGARIGEIARLRGSDIRQVDGVWTVTFIFDDRFGRKERARFVPIHPYLIEQGFLNFVTDSGDRPLFYDPRQPADAGDDVASQRVVRHIAKWVRGLDIDDSDVSPNHGWRHHFRQRARMAGIDSEICDYLQGRVVGTARKRFGYFTPDMLLHEVSKMPKIEIEQAAMTAWQRADTGTAVRHDATP